MLSIVLEDDAIDELNNWKLRSLKPILNDKAANWCSVLVERFSCRRKLSLFKAKLRGLRVSAAQWALLVVVLIKSLKWLLFLNHGFSWKEEGEEGVTGLNNEYFNRLTKDSPELN